ncbi:MAG: endoflagellar motor protein [Leptospira sp.]|nr:endoflagellar motor protein [Leptospira sp.]
MKRFREFRKDRRKKPEGSVHEQSDRWLLTYADMITLLLGLFIVMYSISNVDQEKLKKVAVFIRGGFGLEGIGESLVLDGSSGIADDDFFAPKSQLFRLWERIGYALKKMKDADKLILGLANNEEIKLTIFASSLGEGKIELTKDTELTFIRLAELSKAMDVDIVLRVQIPYIRSIDKKGFANNWDFTAHRASQIARFLSEKYGIEESKISVQGFSDFRELKTEKTSPEDIAKQERIEILIRKRDNR